MMPLGYRIRDLREACGISKGQLAREIGATRRSIHLWENLDCFPSVPALLTLADYFGVSLDDLCDRTVPEPKNMDGKKVYTFPGGGD